MSKQNTGCLMSSSFLYTEGSDYLFSETSKEEPVNLRWTVPVSSSRHLSEYSLS